VQLIRGLAFYLNNTETEVTYSNNLFVIVATERDGPELGRSANLAGE